MDDNENLIFFQMLQAVADDEVGKHLTVMRLRVLAFLGMRGSAHSTAIMLALKQKPVSLSVAVTRLLEDGLVISRADPDDRRRSIFSLSLKGKAFIDRLHRGISGLQHDIQESRNF